MPAKGKMIDNGGRWGRCVGREGCFDASWLALLPTTFLIIVDALEGMQGKNPKPKTPHSQTPGHVTWRHGRCYGGGRKGSHIYMSGRRKAATPTSHPGIRAVLLPPPSHPQQQKWCVNGHLHSPSSPPPHLPPLMSLLAYKVGWGSFCFPTSFSALLFPIRLTCPTPPRQVGKGVEGEWRSESEEKEKRREGMHMSGAGTTQRHAQGGAWRMGKVDVTKRGVEGDGEGRQGRRCLMQKVPMSPFPNQCPPPLTPNTVTAHVRG